MLKVWESWDQFYLAAKSLTGTKYEDGSRNTPGPGLQAGINWYGNKTWAESLALCQSGDESLVPAAERMIEQLESYENGTPARQWSPAPFGAYPVIPDYLSGFPDAMRTLAPTGDVSPVTLYISTTSSAVISADQMLKRGTAILALVMKLQQIRPVELYLLSELDGRDDDYSTYQVIPVDSKPLSLAHACYGLCKIGFARHLTYSLAYKLNDFAGGWPRGYSHDDGYGRATYEKQVKKILGCGPNDLYIKPVSWNDELVNDPIKWVNAQLERYSNLENA